MIKRKPTSPGEILFEEFLLPLEITQKELAAHIGCDYKVINRLVNEKTRITPDMALKLAFSFETTPDFWLNAQIAVDLWKSSKKHYKTSSLIRKHRRRNKLKVN
ncbi:MAG: putative HTH-type transcriptional regulator YbaQ [Candidatus Anoxychlamydiales bacterium]|nr:putative HTH-type transcriptional regulator YbaQ [Candidatus Anoxychlamydiales bacterium]